MASVRTRSASPKSVSFSPILERKYSVERRPASPPELKSTDWRKYFTDFSAYLVVQGEVSGLCDNLAGCGQMRSIQSIPQNVLRTLYHTD
ncbi:hypothetical protein HF086_013328 [Spodoptera exigua]|uniref:Uncharacterized protein n=1 Tax=Spodoptera exigua TaxID=7107 RepID=A0A922M303_SPOEX|nr:hypothetical protein HF086_013328 [Spodoptera exigua]